MSAGATFPAAAVRRRYDLLGTRASIGTDSDDVAELVDQLLGPFRATPGDMVDNLSFSVLHDQRAGVYELREGRRPLVRTSLWQAVTSRLLQELNREALDGFSGFAVHAGVVARGGRAVAFPASSGHGKSTMVAACLAEGFDYVSDEALCVGFDSQAVVPYAKPVQLSSTARGVLGLTVDATELGPPDGEVSLTPADLGARVASPPLALGHVVRLERRPGPDVLSEVPSTHACGWLLRFSFNHHKQPHASFDLAAVLARQSTAWLLQYEHAPSAALLLAERLGGIVRPDGGRGR